MMGKKNWVPKEDMDEKPKYWDELKKEMPHTPRQNATDRLKSIGIANEYLNDLHELFGIKRNIEK